RRPAQHARPAGAALRRTSRGRRARRVAGRGTCARRWDARAAAHPLAHDGEGAGVTPPIRTLLAEDEPPARRRLRAWIERADGLTLVGECGDGRTAVELIRRERPDLVFLDVAMPELSGIEVVEAVGAEHAPAVIFVTAYDEHAVRAFDLAAVDYLLKPFDEERFQRALARAKERLRRPPDPAALLRLLEGRAARPGPERLPVRTRDRI